MEPSQRGGDTPSSHPATHGRLIADGYLTVADVARTLNMSARAVNRWAYTGRIPATMTAEGTWLFQRVDLATVTVDRNKPK